MKGFLTGILAASSILLPPVLASEAGLHLKLSGRRTPPNGSNLNRRGNVAGSSALSDAGDVSYYTDITLGGSSFSVLIDTGSSDLWVAGNVPNAKSTGKSSSVQYAIGSVQGAIKTAALEFAGFSVPDQAFIQVTPDASHPANIGLIGLGPNKGSNVFTEMGDSSGDAVVDRIFRQNTSTPNILTILMGRYNDPTDTFSGDVTVGKTLPGYDDINNQPKLEVGDVSIFHSGDQHWQTLLDANGILGPDGKALSLATTVDSTKNGQQLTVIFDTGFSLPQVPEYVANAVYGRIPGAQFIKRADLGGVWEVPCDREVNMTFLFGGKQFPIHPLDTNLDLNLTDSNGNRVCIGAFQPITTNTGGFYDAILGMAFLRNAYTLINYGDFVDGGSSKADPFVQLLPITNDTAEAHKDFVKVRLGGKDNANWSLLPPSSSGSPPDTESNLVRRLKYYAPIIGAVIGALLIGIIIWMLCRGYRGRKKVGKPMFGTGQRYQPLNDPAPQGAVDLHLMNQQRDVRQSQRYSGPPPDYDYEAAPRHSTDLAGKNPWDARY